MIKIIVDSTCDLPDYLLKKFDIRVLPLHITLGENEYRDKENIQVEEVYTQMRNGVMPKTSQVGSDDLYDTFKEYCIKGCHFIYIAFSSALSGTYQSAKLTLSELREEYSDIKMEVLDSKSGSMATGLIALQAVTLILAGYEFETIVEQITAMAAHIEHIFTISDLKWLVKGGRIDRLQGMIGTLMNVKPILDVKNGSMEIIRKVRGRDNALNSVVDILMERIKDFPEQLIGITHSDDAQGAEALRKSIAERTGAKNFVINKIGGVLASHLGIGGIGVFFLNKRPAFYID